MMSAFEEINDSTGPEPQLPFVPPFPAKLQTPANTTQRPRAATKTTELVDTAEPGTLKPAADGSWSEVVSKGEIHCLCSTADGGILLSGSTNVRLWDGATGENIHSVAMKARTKTKCMAREPPSLRGAARAGAAGAGQEQQGVGRDVIWCGHSDGRLSELVIVEGEREAQLTRQFEAHRSAVTAILVTPGREIWTGSDHGTIRCWSITEVAMNQQRTTKSTGCPFYKPDCLAELTWEGHKGQEVRCLISVPAVGTVWSGSTGKGGTHVWDAAPLPADEVSSHTHLEALTSEEAMHLVCGTMVQLSAEAVAQAIVGGSQAKAHANEGGVEGGVPGLSVWTGHTNGRLAQWSPVRGAATLLRSWQAHSEGRWVTQVVAHTSAGGSGCDVVWVGFEDGLMYAYNAHTAALLSECRAHHSHLVALTTFSDHSRGAAAAAGTLHHKADGGWRHTKLASASTKGTLRAWNAVAGVKKAPPSAYERNRYLAGRGTYGGSEYVVYDTLAMHAFGRRVSKDDGHDCEPVQFKVNLHVYDLGKDSRGFRALKAINTQALGAFHVAVELCGWEWSFGWNEDGTTGVFSGLPAKCDMHTYRQAVPMGITTLSPMEIDQKLALLEEEWMGDTYDMLDRNCAHFCNVLCHELGVGEVPNWVNRAAGVGSSIASGLETLVSLKSVFARKNKAVGSKYAEGGGEGAAESAEGVAAPPRGNS